jgi:hypothetical protein
MDTSNGRGHRPFGCGPSRLPEYPSDSTSRAIGGSSQSAQEELDARIFVTRVSLSKVGCGPCGWLISVT